MCIYGEFEPYHGSEIKLLYNISSVYLAEDMFFIKCVKNYTNLNEIIDIVNNNVYNDNQEVIPWL